MTSLSNDHDDYITQDYGSPTSTVSSGFGPSHTTCPHRDDNLPEVVGEDASQRPLTALDTGYIGKFGSCPESRSTEKLNDTTKVVVPSEHSTSNQNPQSAASTTKAVPWDVKTTGGVSIQSESGFEKSIANEGGVGPAKDGTIMGLGRKSFFILLTVVAVIVVIAVGAGVGGAVAATRNNNKSNDSPAEAGSTTSVS
ncbi:hypothetical protein VFPPC_11686 [Pochonia chlamydosporia 170]|uniref:Uncharacterized protein n=1 Tax=Pochonia chlamydosporia 170 TaxID=1380566 RepID=A0A179FVJ1_METCM|nr:hypothetical protein VFPPC_11686 [Pochonia chlamydosporia 170]OAQ69632.1 hypothetical protein VFPPC_11686 [Pochonia chlamydosporia 170]